MEPGIKFNATWSDEDLTNLHVEICDGASLFATEIWVSHQQLRDTVAGLHVFKNQIRGGIFNLRFGEFGPEYASGALDVRLQFRKLAKILIQVSAQSGFTRFEDRELASEAKLYLVSEPALLDAFIDAFQAPSEGSSTEAVLEAFSLN